MNQPRQFLLKAIRCRKHMMRTGTSKRNPMLVAAALRKVEPWLLAYPKATPEQVARHIQRNKEAVYCLIPGPSSATGDHMIEQFNHILSQPYGTLSQPRDRAGQNSSAAH